MRKILLESTTLVIVKGKENDIMFRLLLRLMGRRWKGTYPRLNVLATMSGDL